MKHLRMLVLFALFVTMLHNSETLKIHNKKPHLKEIPAYKTFYMTQKIDHFNFRDDRTFQQRYLLNGYFWL
jgi:hypothetical protein